MQEQRAFYAHVLRFDAQDQIELVRDALVVVEGGVITMLGLASQLESKLGPQVERVDWRGKTIAPGFIDLHLHYPQLDVIACAADGLLPWLNEHTFPQEAKFSDPAHAAAVSKLFLDEMLRNGLTTGMVYCTSHKTSVDAFFTEALARGLRMVAGKCLMDRNSPDGVRDDTEQSLVDSEALIQAWHGKDRLGYALTPRFAPSCSDAQLQGAAYLAQKYAASHGGVWVQTHVAENAEEIAWVRSLYPQARSYLEVYHHFGLLRERSMYAHCIYLDARDRALMQETGAAAAVCPSSNLFLGSGLFDFSLADAAGMQYGLASDVGGGSSFSPFRTMFCAFEVARQRGKSMAPSELWYRHTLGGAKAMGVDQKIGNLAVGYEADFVVLDDQATALLSRRSREADSLEQWLFGLIVLGDDRAIARTYIAGHEASLN